MGNLGLTFLSVLLFICVLESALETKVFVSTFVHLCT